MKQVKGAKIVVQHCLDFQPVLDFIASLPKSLLIKELAWEAWQKSKWKRLLIPTYLQNKGVKKVRECGARTHLNGTFKNIPTIEIGKLISRLCKNYEIGKDKFVINKVAISDGKHTAIFRKMRKEIKFPNDNRKKLMVLGLASPSMNGASHLFSALSVKKIACQMMKTERTIVLCSEVR